MPQTAPLAIEAHVDIAAPPAAVWAAVGDPTRMPEWSPELRRLKVLGGRPRVGATLLGVNRRGLVVWPTTSRVIRYEPERAIAWKTRESGATWIYELAATQGGTRLTGRRDLARFGLGTTVLGPLLGGAQGHDEELAAGIATTLQRIRASVEEF